MAGRGTRFAFERAKVGNSRPKAVRACALLDQRNTQKIERKHLTLRTRIKRLVRKTICFSKSIQMHDIVIGLFVNRYAFGLLVSSGHLHI